MDQLPLPFLHSPLTNLHCNRVSNLCKVSPLILDVLISSQEVVFTFLHASKVCRSPTSPSMLPKPVYLRCQKFFSSFHHRADFAPHLRHKPIPIQHRLRLGQLCSPRIFPVSILFVRLPMLARFCIQRKGHCIINNLHVRFTW